MEYVGKLSYHDPLYGILKKDILPQVRHHKVHDPSFSVYRLHGSNHVYLYREERSSVELVGKFFKLDHRSHERAVSYMESEYHALERMRALGFNRSPHQVIRPLGCYPECNALLVEEYSHGVPFSLYIQRALEGRMDVLFDKLRALAYFLARWHNHTVNHHPVHFDGECDYFYNIINRLKTHAVGLEADWHYFAERIEHWRHRPEMWQDTQVFVHGDPTPANILFGQDLSVIAIDLERCKYTDRAFDLGRIVAELKHYFIQSRKNLSAGEDAIGHFLWEYSCHFPDRHATFKAITRRIPFYMALTLLRIAPNTWVSKRQRARLVMQARLTLQ